MYYMIKYLANKKIPVYLQHFDLSMIFIQFFLNKIYSILQKKSYFCNTLHA